MARSPRGPERLKAGFPPGRPAFAHKIGTGSANRGLTTAYNDVGVLTLADKRSYATAVAFLTGSTAAETRAARADLLADLGRAIVRSDRLGCTATSRPTQPLRPAADGGYTAHQPQSSRGAPAPHGKDQSRQP